MMCSVGGCGRRVHARGWCQAHYKRWKKCGDPGGAEVRERTPGVTCGTVSGYTNLGCRCGACGDAKRAYDAAWKEANPSYHRDRHLSRKYGITTEQYEALLEAQSNGCAICGSTDPGRDGHVYLHVDHDHETGAIRGLLCDFCNKGLGQFKDEPGRLRAAAEYLENARTPA